VLFWPIAWSPDGSQIAGTAVTAGQVGDIHLWSIAERTYRRLRWAREGLVDYSLAFVDRDHLVYGSGGEVWLGDLRGGAPRRLYAPAPGHIINNLSASRDGLALTWIDNADESDIWLMTLEEQTTP
jgi:hypothetical protein